MSSGKNLHGLTWRVVSVCIFVGIKEQFNFEVPSDNWLWIVILGVVNTGFGCSCIFHHYQNFQYKQLLFVDILSHYLL